MSPIHITFAVLITSLLFYIVTLVYFYFRSQPNVETEKYPYQAKDLFNDSEVRFFGLLLEFSGSNFIVLAKVRLWDIIDTIKGLDKSCRCGFQNKICSKHIDFLLITPHDYKIVLAIELDGSSHNSKKANKNDNFKNNVFRAANIPLLRINADTHMDIMLLNELVRITLKANTCQVPPQIISR